MFHDPLQRRTIVDNRAKNSLARGMKEPSRAAAYIAFRRTHSTLTTEDDNRPIMVLQDGVDHPSAQKQPLLDYGPVFWLDTAPHQPGSTVLSHLFSPIPL